MKITDRAVTAIKKNNRLIGRLIMTFNRGQNTIENWMKADDSPLTTPAAINIISEETGLAQDEILELADKDTIAA